MENRHQTPTRRFMRLPEVSKVTGLSRSMIYLEMDRGTFPRPVKISDRLNGWLESSIEQWIDARLAARDGAEAA
ncbi:MAG: hypothetical protein A2792_01900 [Sphingomonadales bacterium RIFCSPHIGHO2_01_FULL_65_20]|jgi:prophage regulatory protein|uniref:helix-turn-helix transcriptional regulator n=1 Tax=unclassified Blastomonas TaxID=2626550 RepID=UPI00082C8D1F|nr:AlpA family transcriptional regulator [Blastomonas sp.]MCH2240225.1 AlpA family transcriptional regulator [Blastomonas sp.]OHC96207.1 MAG: hypothetical protein A2792_01900 [Sphingomonadales bacterium RIFCSPHIGHO2_01_FULL_65_20]